ncbi:MAG TPA: 50S ribosomal protein L25/general stress protein Ctc [Xanthobacteraceae bacterium]|jgi:large subunit ribosomal protein L25|nr:50S ribosomal protein L25/general stress protein Ctc [Xanthobacteraceae bacterium]
MTAKAVLKAIARPGVGKGAARAARRAGQVPAVIYGDKKPPVSISLEFSEVSKRLNVGHFLTTLIDIDLDGTKHQVIPRGFQLDPLRDTLTHVDFQRVAPGSTLRVAIPMKFINPEESPGIKRGGTLNIVRHTVEFICPVEKIPEFIEADLTGLEIGKSLHISAVKLPEGIKPVISDRDFTVATIVSSSGYLEEQAAAKAKAEAEATAAAAAAAAPGAEGAPAPAEGAAPAAEAAAGDAKAGADKAKK